MHPWSRISLRSKFYALLLAFALTGLAAFAMLFEWSFRNTEDATARADRAVESLVGTYVENLRSTHAFLASAFVYDVSEMNANRVGLQSDSLLATGLVRAIAFFTSDGSCFYASDTSFVKMRSQPEAKAAASQYALASKQHISENEKAALERLAGDGSDMQTMIREQSGPDTLTIIQRYGRQREVLGYTVTSFSLEKIQQIRTRLLQENIQKKADERRGAIALSLGFTLTFVSLLLFGFLLFFRHLIRPVLQLHVVTQALEEGNYEARAHLESRDEVGMLGRHINEMAASLERNMRRMNVQVEFAKQLSFARTPGEALTLFVDRVGSELSETRLRPHPWLIQWNHEFATHFTSEELTCPVLEPMAFLPPERRDSFSILHGEKEFCRIVGALPPAEDLGEADRAFALSCAILFANTLESLRSTQERIRLQTEFMQVRLQKLGHVAVYLGDRLSSPMQALVLAGEELADELPADTPEVRRLVSAIERNVQAMGEELEILKKYRKYASADALLADLDAVEQAKP